MPAIPFLYLPIAVALGEALSASEFFLWPRDRRPGNPPGKRAPLLALSALLMIPGLIALTINTVRLTDLYSWNNQNINEMQVELALWIRENIPPHEMIAVNDAGALRFLGGHTILDLQGLNNHEVLLHGALPQIALHRPHYFALFPSWAPEIMQDPSFIPRLGVRASKYTICDCSQEEIVLFEKTY